MSIVGLEKKGAAAASPLSGDIASSPDALDDPSPVDQDPAPANDSGSADQDPAPAKDPGPVDQDPAPANEPDPIEPDPAPSNKPVNDRMTWITENTPAIRALGLAFVILALTTFPALYISYAAFDFVTQGTMITSPSATPTLIFKFALIKSDLFNLFNIIALPTLTAFFGASVGKYDRGNVSWILFFYLLVLFAVTYLPELISSPIAGTGTSSRVSWSNTLTTLNIDPNLVSEYLVRVRNGALAAIAVMAGIKLASQQ
ncbi:hypothetical protein NKH74_30380 [Mesorhizobium sp. M0933]|uniref:hypothetical protein n=1 Tax=Mesorhizobium sp. M0933 TaxID=2957030 RepID=UPI00333C9340